jgi:hypothetical protein
MSRLTSRPDEPAVRPSRNFLFVHETETVERYRAMVVRELMEYLGAEDKRSIKLSPQSEVVMLHHSLGMAIRNEYELWMPEHDVTAIFHLCEGSHPLANEAPNMPTSIQVGDRMMNISGTSVHIDEHPCHPDNFSMSCVQSLWETLQ